MESDQVVTKVTSKRWYTSGMITLSGSFLCQGSWLWRATADRRAAPEGAERGCLKHLRSRYEVYFMTPDEPVKSAGIRIVIAEDQAQVRRGAAHLLSFEPDMEVVGQACNGVEAVELARVLHPDVVLMDLHM